MQSPLLSLQTFDFKMVNSMLVSSSSDDSLLEPTGGIDDVISHRGLVSVTPEVPLSYVAQPLLLERIRISEIGSDAFYGAIQSSNRLKAIEADLKRTLGSEISGLDGNREAGTGLLFRQLDLLSNRRPTRDRFIGKSLVRNTSSEKEKELSTEEIVRVAAVHFIQSSDHTEGDPSIIRYGLSSSLAGLSSVERKGVGLASLLLAAAEKLYYKQYDRARSLLSHCYKLSSSSGNALERVVYYFTEALQERVDREIGTLTLKRPRDITGFPTLDVNKAMLAANSAQLAYHEKVPFSQMMQYISIQTIIDTVASSTRIHMIDLAIRYGVHWTVLMQALATRHTCPVEYLKITAVAMSPEDTDVVAKRGKSLTSFADTLGLALEFETVVVSDMKHLRMEMFDVEEGEALGVHSLMGMNAMIAKRGDLEHLMRVLKKLKPDVITVADVEGKHNSTSFINRFSEALFSYSAMYDTLDTYMDREDKDRMVIEGSFYSQGIRSIVAAEGSERMVRHVGISMWRSFFARFGLLETKLNEWSQYQVSLLANQFAHGSYCTLHKNGRSLIFGWKGTPQFFVSAWKFL